MKTQLPVMKAQQPDRDTLKKLIADHHFFRGMNPDFLPFLASAATFVEYEPQQLIFNEAAEADHFYLINWGCGGLEAHVPLKNSVTVQRIGNGEALGWSWFFAPHSWRFSARTLDATEVIEFDAKALREYADQNHDFGYDLLVRMGQVIRDRLQSTRELLMDYCVDDPNENASAE